MSEPAQDWEASLEAALGPIVLPRGGETRIFAVDGRTPTRVCEPATIEDLSASLAACDRLGLAVVPAGCGAQLDTGRPPLRYDVAVSTRRLCRVVAHEAADLTVTVEAGITMAAMNAQLAADAQRLPLDPPHPETATIGAIVATDAWGPARHAEGKVRDLLVGVRAVLADGTIVHGGGRVVKNVAGYDLMKLFAGSHGNLGIIAEASFKLRPLPAHREILVIERPTLASAIDLCLELRDAEIAPEFVTACTGPSTPIVATGLAGTAAEVAAQREELRRGCHDAPWQPAIDPEALYVRLRDFPCGAAWGGRLSLPPSELSALLETISKEARATGSDCEVASHPSAGSAWLRWAPASDEDAIPSASRWRSLAEERGGALVWTRLPTAAKAHLEPWGTLRGEKLQRAMKQTLDPNHRLSPGRLFA